MKSYRFEVVRRRYDRYGWHVVSIDGPRRRVLARSARTYRSPKRVKRAIARLQTAQVVDVSGTDENGVSLPATSFGVVPGVVPLIVAERPADYELAARPRVEARADPDVAQQQQQQVAQGGAESEPEPKPEDKGRRGRRGKRAE